MTFKSLNENILTVSESGIVIGNQIGKAEVLVTHESSNKTAIVYVNVVPENKVAVPEVLVSNNHVSSLKADGTVWTWGNNTNGELGIGDFNTKATPVQVVGLENIIDIAVGYHDTLAVKSDGTVWSFGANSNGQLGNHSSKTSNIPVQVLDEDGNPLTNIVKVASNPNNYRSFAIDKDGNVWRWGRSYGSYASKVDELEQIIDISLSYAVNYKGEVIKLSNLSKLDLENITRVSEGNGFALFLSLDGKGYGIGNNSYGQLGNGTSTTVSKPTAIVNSDGSDVLTGIKELTAGNNFAIGRS